MPKRKAKTERATSEVKVEVEINLDGEGSFSIDTGIPFFDHMLAQFARHGYFDLKIKLSGTSKSIFTTRSKTSALPSATLS